MAIRTPHPWPVRPAPTTFAPGGGVGFLAALALTMGCGSAQNAASTDGPAQSGQTGSPNADPPDYVTPAPHEPGGGGGTDGETGGGAEPSVLPDPGPPPSSTLRLLGKTLLAPNLDGTTLFDVSDSMAPRAVASLPGVRGPLHADSAAAVTMNVWEEVNISAETIPDALPYYRSALAVYDLREPAQPKLLRELELPQGVAKSVVTDVGVTLLGADLDLQEPACGAVVGELLGPQPTVMGLWAEAHLANGDEFTLATRREFAPGHWVSSKNQLHAAYVRSEETEGFGAPTPPFELELVDLRSLDIVLTLSLGEAELGEPWGGTLELDSYGDLVALSGGPRVLFWDLGSGQSLPALALDAPTVELSFTGDGRYLSVGGSNRLLAVDHTASPPNVSLVEPAAGTSATFVGQLHAFGDGFISIGSGANDALVATRYALVEDRLSQVGELTTSWTNPSELYGARAWEVNAEHERVSFVRRSGESGEGQLGILAVADGELAASALVTLTRAEPYPVHLSDAVIDITATQVQPVGIAVSGGAVNLDSGEPTFTAIESVWRQLEHAGISWTVHRTDTGLWTLSARDSVASSPTWIDLPHLVNDVRAIDDTHVAAIGLSVLGDCEAADGGPGFPECNPAAGSREAARALPFVNGLSVLRVEGGEVSVVESFVLSSRIEAPTTPGVSQRVNWRNVLDLTPEHWAIVANVTRECSSVESCEQLGVTPYVSYGSSGSGACPAPGECEPSAPQIQEFINGYQRETWLLPFDLSNPEAPVRAALVQGGASLDVHGLANLGPPVLRGEVDGEPVWAYRSVEQVYDETGNSVLDENERPIARTYLQSFRFHDGALRFDDAVQVPGSVVALSAPRASERLDESELTVFTAEPQFSSPSDQVWVVHRLAVGAGQAWIEETLPIGDHITGMQQTADRIGVITAPADACTEHARYGVVAIDTRGSEMTLSSALELPSSAGWGYAFSVYAPIVDEPGVITVAGGPAHGRGRLLVDVTMDPPSVVRYETFDEYEAFEW